MTKSQRRTIVKSITRILKKHAYSTPEAALQIAIFEQALFDLYDCSEGTTYADLMSAKQYLDSDLAQLDAAGIEPSFAKRLLAEAGEKIRTGISLSVATTIGMSNAALQTEMAL